MSAENSTKTAIMMTRMVLKGTTFEPRGMGVLAYMVANDVGPEDLEDKVAEILAYLEKTKPEEDEG